MQMHTTCGALSALHSMLAQFQCIYSGFQEAFVQLPDIWMPVFRLMIARRMPLGRLCQSTDSDVTMQSMRRHLFIGSPIEEGL